MHIPPPFEQHVSAQLHDLIDAFPFGTLVVSTSAGIIIDHLPFELDRAGGVLHGHVARVNPLFEAHSNGAEATVAFVGPHGYVTPSWYPSKREHHKVTPTWNYAVVHARGPMTIVEDEERLLRHLGALTERYEAGRREPWAIGDAPVRYIRKELKRIVGFEIVISHLAGKWKLGQNRSMADREGLADGLAAEADPLARRLGEFVGATIGAEPRSEPRRRTKGIGRP